jgi:hypothetical protein
MTAAFLRLDLSSWFVRKNTIYTLLLIAASGVLLPVPGMAIVSAALVSSLMVSTPFLADERGHLDTLYGVLPISRRTVVIGRALSVLAYFVVAAVLATVVTVAVVTVRGEELPIEVLLAAHAGAFAFVGLSMALQLPVLFRVGYERGRTMAYAPAFVIAGLAWLLQATGARAPLQDTLAGVPLITIAGLGVLAGVIGILGAIAVAVGRYRSREL